VKTMRYPDKCFQLADISKGIHKIASTNMDALSTLIPISFYGFKKHRSSINGCSRYEACKFHLHELNVINGAQDNQCTNCMAYNFVLLFSTQICNFFQLTQ